MKCTKCDTECNVINNDWRKFCSNCNCSYLLHIDRNNRSDDSLELVNEICCISKSTERTLVESSKLSKTFGTVWLPLGIQPSEVDRFLKYFPSNTDIRRTMLMKSDNRYLELNLQLPSQDRSLKNLSFVFETESKNRAEIFFNERRNESCNVARIDHLDRSEGNTCSECLDSMGFGEVCVMLPKGKKASSEVWHPHCFKCIKCKHLLIDYIYCWDAKSGTGPYCLRDYDDKYHVRCASCDEMIFDEQYSSIMDEAYHLDHLRCSTCDAQISDTKFILESDVSIASRSWKCIGCLAETKRSYCTICQEIIEISHSSIIFGGLLAHENCVTCGICSKDLCSSTASEYIKDTNCLFCLQCNEQRTPSSCHKCHQSIESDKDDSISRGLLTWHKACLTCIRCQKNVSCSEPFVVINDPDNISRSTTTSSEQKYTICKDCFFNHHIDICGICNEKINNEGVQYGSKLYHKSCFLCSECSEELNPSTFTIKDDQTYCVPCYSRLFCKSCYYCASPIMGSESTEKLIGFENRSWHEKCFLCTNCHKSVVESGFLFDNEKIICIECGVK